MLKILRHAPRREDPTMNRSLSLVLLAGAMAVSHPSFASAGNAFRETDLVSDIPGRAALTDSNLVNPWGIVFDAHGNLRVADNGSGHSTLYARNGSSLSPTF